VSFIKLNNEQKMIHDEFRKFAVSEIEPIADEIEKNGVFPKTIVDKLAELGLLGLIIPEKYGGVELDMTSLCIAVEEISKICASIGTILVVNNCLVAYPLLKFGEESLKEKYLNKLAAGEIGGFICQPEIDLPEEKNDLKIEGEVFIFSGHREFILNGNAANFYIFPIQINKTTKYFIFDKNAKGFFSNSKNLLGMRAAGFTGAEFQDLILQEKKCFFTDEKNIQSEIHNFSNIGLSAISLGIAQSALDTSIKYAKERIQFGRPIAEFPMIREMLTNMKIKIETTRLLIYDVASRFDNNEDYFEQSKIARLTASETGIFCGLNSIQVHGGYGYMKDYPLERYFRDAKVIQLLEASPRIMREEIAKGLLK